ncbi:hypothetical protein [Entomomonas asaccharolytica]|uniref:DUF4292 domain-containing protein n=1 Tax=Entomomonas asaccharolytica TaxID=2785331 RepID=A0A974NE81_9GAMM|nr:hypothetical protein [Entomomonas asaccharolytica]QQP84991.1 hypothetical protein JHT90_11410 [Entomomonas asaccharolytica]
MNIKYNILNSIIITMAMAATVAYANPKSCNTADIIQKIEQRVDSITDYRVTIVSAVNEQKPAEMTLYGKRPDLLKAVMQLSETDKLTIVYDKQYQWIEEGNMVYQVNLSKSERRTAERPFDTDYSLAGGLLSGEDYVGTIKTMLTIYNLKASCQANTITLIGDLDIPKFTEYTKSRNITAPLEEFVEQFAKTLKKATIKVDKNNYLVTSYHLVGTDKFNVQFNNYDFSSLSAEQLSYKIPEGIKPIDITPGAPQSEPVPATDGESN